MKLEDAQETGHIWKKSPFPEHLFWGIHVKTYRVWGSCSSLFQDSSEPGALKKWHPKGIQCKPLSEYDGSKGSRFSEILACSCIFCRQKQFPINLYLVTIWSVHLFVSNIYTLPQTNISILWKTAVGFDEISFWGPRHELLVSRSVYKWAILNYTSCPSCGRASASCDESWFFWRVACKVTWSYSHIYIPSHTTTQMEHWGITGILYSIRGLMHSEENVWGRAGQGTGLRDFRGDAFGKRRRWDIFGKPLRHLSWQLSK